eukprot:6460428-Ditylum_brightwellii.AAC.1
MREDGQLWSILLWLRDGLLELNKCSYHIIHFFFYPDGTPQMQHQQHDHCFQIHKANTRQECANTTQISLEPSQDPRSLQSLCRHQ